MLDARSLMLDAGCSALDVERLPVNGTAPKTFGGWRLRLKLRKLSVSTFMPAPIFGPMHGMNMDGPIKSLQRNFSERMKM
jgi:hypothetical protein